MKKNELLRLVSPCGLVCYTCDAMKDGAINKAAKKLMYVLDSYDTFLKNTPGARSISGKYNDFLEVLGYLADVRCNGCRTDHCMNSNCVVPECAKNKNIHFCYECKEFPCAKTEFPDSLKETWIMKNNKIREIGIIKYFEEEKKKPHYAS